MGRPLLHAALLLLLPAGLVGSSLARDVPASQPAAAQAPVEALQGLVDGHERYVQGRMQHPHLSEVRRAETAAQGQHPFAVILSCSDSRVPPELIFDTGIGDLFVVRIAGNVAGTDEIGTIEYGVEHLHAPVVLVLGHTRCGAVTAVVEHAHVTANIAKLVEPIVPAAKAMRAQHPTAPQSELVALTIRQNVLQGMSDLLRQSEDLRRYVAEGKVTLVGGVYDIATGKIDWMGKHPQQAELLQGNAKDAHPQHNATSPATAPSSSARTDNLLALVCLLIAAAVVSTLVIRVTGARPTQG